MTTKQALSHSLLIVVSLTGCSILHPSAPGLYTMQTEVQGNGLEFQLILEADRQGKMQISQDNVLLSSDSFSWGKTSRGLKLLSSNNTRLITLVWTNADLRVVTEKGKTNGEVFRRMEPPLEQVPPSVK